jgi:riboflavin biosynthesis pyrimidine reductase
MTVASLDDIAELPDTSAELNRYYGEPPVGVRANMVMTADGAGAFHGRTKAISDDADQELLRHLRGHADAVLVGSATVQAERYGPVRLDPDAIAARQLSGRVPVPPIVVVTARANLPATLPVFTHDGPRTIVATLARSAEQAAPLREVGEVLVVGEDAIDPRRLVDALAERGMNRLLCEGGPYLLSQLVEHDLVDDMCLTVSPFLAGSQPTTLQPPSGLRAPTRMRLRHVLTRNGLLYLRFARQ